MGDGEKTKVEGERKGRKWRALRRNGAETGDSDGQWATVDSSNRTKTWTEGETVGGQPLPACDLCKPYIPSEGGQRRKRTRIPYTNRNRGREATWTCAVRRKKSLVSPSTGPSLHFFFPFLCFSNCSAETVREIKLTPPTCWQPSEFLSQRPVRSFCP